jgi:hypothetical protein
MSTKSNVPGLNLPTQKAMLAGTPRDSAIQANNNVNQKSASLSAAVGGSRKNTRRRKGGGIVPPQFQMQYSAESGPDGRDSLSAVVGGSRKNTRHRKGGAIVAPQFQMQYSDQSGPGGSPNNQVQQNSQISTQQSANAALDSGALTKGGKRIRRSRKGGNPDWKWGCYSGGKKKSKTSKKSKSKTRRRTRRRR